jgi:hypothetical protein
MSRRVPRWLLVLYPRAWRQRYGAEVASLSDELISAGETTWPRAVLNLAAGAAAERGRTVASPRGAMVAGAAAVVAVVTGVGLAAADGAPGAGAVAVNITAARVASMKCVTPPALRAGNPAWRSWSLAPIVPGWTEWAPAGTRVHLSWAGLLPAAIWRLSWTVPPAAGARGHGGQVKRAQVCGRGGWVAYYAGPRATAPVPYPAGGWAVISPGAGRVTCTTGRPSGGKAVRQRLSRPHGTPGPQAAPPRVLAPFICGKAARAVNVMPGPLCAGLAGPGIQVILPPKLVAPYIRGRVVRPGAAPSSPGVKASPPGPVRTRVPPGLVPGPLCAGLAGPGIQVSLPPGALAPYVRGWVGGPVTVMPGALAPYVRGWVGGPVTVMPGALAPYVRGRVGGPVTVMPGHLCAGLAWPGIQVFPPPKALAPGVHAKVTAPRAVPASPGVKFVPPGVAPGPFRVGVFPPAGAASRQVRARLAPPRPLCLRRLVYGGLAPLRVWLAPPAVLVPPVGVLVPPGLMPGARIHFWTQVPRTPPSGPPARL